MPFAGLGTDPCSLLNTQTPSWTFTMWLSGTPSTDAFNAQSDDPKAYTNIADSGLTRAFKAYYDASSANTPGNSNVLNATATTASTVYPVVEFMKNKTLSNVLLNSSTTSFTLFPILDVTPSVTEYSSTFTVSATSTNFTRLTPYILTRDQIYSTTNPENTLLGIYNAEQSGTVTSAQLEKKRDLQNINNKFFAAFLCEYCFYRTRYQWLLEKYFNVYSISTTTYPTLTLATWPNLARLFTGGGNAENQYTSGSTNLTQADYLKGLAFHLATLSKRMANMRAILNQVNVYYDSILQEILRTINANSGSGSNTQLATTLNALRNSAKESQKVLDQRQFMESAMKYTSEKNRYANVMLGLYAFLNIAALAMIFKLKSS